MAKPDVTYTRQGGRKIELYIPFKWKGRSYTALNIGPCSLDHLMRWQEGKFKTSIALLADMSGQPEAMIRRICYPDIDRVLAAFVDMVPAAIQADIGQGAVPVTESQAKPLETGKDFDEVLSDQREAELVAQEQVRDDDERAFHEKEVADQAIPSGMPQWPYPGGTPPDDPGPIPDDPPEATNFDPMSEI
jgi:hypothetical protein